MSVFLILTACVVHVIAAAAPWPTVDDLLLCPRGSYYFSKVEGATNTRKDYGSYGQAVGTAAPVPRGAYVCRPCSLCAIGAVVLSPCTSDADTVCGDCELKDYVVDVESNTCHPRSAISEGKQDETAGRAPSSQLNQHGEADGCGHHDKDEAFQVSETSVDALFIASATLFAVVLAVSVVLVIVALVAKLKYPKVKKNTTGRNLPKKIPALSSSHKEGIKSSENKKTGHVNACYKDDEDLSLI
ncbi:uncharacterized protein [Ptychodera flava]|uniref:uncharacterized protein n=1 Tax=Ptychodera flava TaxID=63121 RepID=UPI00396A86B9